MSYASSAAASFALRRAAINYENLPEEEELPSEPPLPAAFSGAMSAFAQPKSEEVCELLPFKEEAPPLLKSRLLEMPGDILSLIRSFLSCWENARISSVCRDFYTGWEIIPIEDASLYKILLQIFQISAAPLKNRLLEQRLKECLTLLERIHFYKEWEQNRGSMTKVFHRARDPSLKEHEIGRILQKIVDLYAIQETLFFPRAPVFFPHNGEMWVRRESSGRIVRLLHPAPCICSSACMLGCGGGLVAAACTGASAGILSVASLFLCMSGGFWCHTYCVTPIQERVPVCPHWFKVERRALAPLVLVANAALLHGKNPERLEADVLEF